MIRYQIAQGMHIYEYMVIRIGYRLTDIGTSKLTIK